ncbi:Mg2+ and Co2+ transporter [Ligilactobacillus pabuli]|uniref:Mg2+ and Co2+ transporter n=1 Tax=Ligilactobacillus pabuli TaxID=2886039 RepID=A0ABQ5JJJ0_9LACO|nr:magnesium transporter CorA family protein [Ligilactobacillus pabuli]GKS81437.1 Mg2+ and Co2+ transporter [Ligilactobacillus pabuli]
MIKLINLPDELTLIQTSKLAPVEIAELMGRYGLTQEVIDYVIDRDESPNYVYDEDSGDELFIVQIPHAMQGTGLRYITQPVGFLLHEKALFTFNPSGESGFDQILAKNLHKHAHNLAELLFAVLFDLMDSFVPIMHQLTKQRNQLDKVLNQEIKNKQLVSLSHLQQTLSYFSSASELNLTMFHKLPRTHFFTTSTSQDELDDKKAILEDVTIEGEQVARMIETELAVVGRIGDTFNTIANNNLNDTMKTLTIWSLALTIPTILTGFYGMNVRLPGSHSSTAWFGIILLSLIIALLLLLGLRLRHKL